jgi:hypothetical protein
MNIYIYIYIYYYWIDRSHVVRWPFVNMNMIMFEWDRCDIFLSNQNITRAMWHLFVQSKYYKVDMTSFCPIKILQRPTERWSKFIMTMSSDASAIMDGAILAPVPRPPCALHVCRCFLYVRLPEVRFHDVLYRIPRGNMYIYIYEKPNIWRVDVPYGISCSVFCVQSKVPAHKYHTMVRLRFLWRVFNREMDRYISEWKDMIRSSI